MAEQVSKHSGVLPQADGAAPRRPARYALRIAAIYFVISVLWIAISDWAVERLVISLSWSHRMETIISTIKGWGFVVITAGLLYLLVRHSMRELQQTEDRMRGELRAIAEQYQLLFLHSPVAMLIFAVADQRILAANDVCVVLFGYSTAELGTMSILDLLAEEERERALALGRAGLPTVSGPRIWRSLRRDGTVLFTETMSHEIDFAGHAARIALLTNVTERLKTDQALAEYRALLEHRVAERTEELSQANWKLRGEVDERHRIAEDLRAATQAAESASAAKSIFLANTSHEIRTPLTSILGYADLLTDRGLAAEQRERYLAVLAQNAQHLLKLIDDLLDLSRAEMGKVRVIFAEHSPREIAEQAVELLHPRAAEKALDFSLRFAGALPETMHTDGVRLRQILLNLLSNAIKFTSHGRVSLTVGGPPECAAGAVRFAVADTGIGMSPEQSRRVFEPFYQAEQGAARRYGGSGLGLAISRQLAQQMGGTLTFTTAPESGSTFVLDLPVMVPARLRQTAPPGAGGGGPESIEGHILLADDTANIRWLVEEYLTRAGATVTAVADGAEAVRVIERSLAADAGGAGEGHGAVDLVLLDLNMPVVDGRQALARMRQAGYRGPVVGLTADAGAKSSAQWVAEGWTAMASKPIDRQSFIPLLARLVAERDRNAVVAGL